MRSFAAGVVCFTVALLYAPWTRSAHDSASVPSPEFHFPLQDNALASLEPGNEYTAVASPELEWRLDPVFGTVIDCNASLGTYLKIPNVTYGASGPFTISFWLQVKENSGSDLNYAFSQIGPTGANIDDASSQVHLYLPEQSHPHYGVLRAIVLDTTDPIEDPTDPTYLDSDGCVVDPDCTAASEFRSADPADGQWHQIVLSTSPNEGDKGFRIFIDGAEAAAMVDGNDYLSNLGTIHTATGGEALDLGGDIHLCSRVDENENRFLSGSITQLKIWNEALTDHQIQDLYDIDPFTPFVRANTPETEFSSPQGMTAQGACQSPCTEYMGERSCLAPSGELLPCNVTSYVATMASNSSLSEANATESAGSPLMDTVAQSRYEMAKDCVSECESVNGLIGCRTATGELRGCLMTPSTDGTNETAAGVAYGAGSIVGSADPILIDGQPLCSANVIPGLETISSCGSGYICFPLTQKQLEDALGTAAPKEDALGGPGSVGICAYASSNVMLPPAAVVPPADAFFPLASRSLESYPLGRYKTLNAGASIVEDPVFGAALRCNADEKDAIGIEPVPYGINGSFAINIWVRPDNMSGDAFAYLFSHINTAVYGSESIGDNGFGPNQVQLLLPEEDHPSYGVARTFVRDGNDYYVGAESESYVDSDGLLSFNGPRDPKHDLFDGKWHMFTLSSQTDGSPGFAFYVDGELVGGMNTSVTPFAADSGVELHVPGGDPMNIDGDIALCTRSYDNSVRHFDGEMAYLSIWDQSLDADQIGALYEAVAGSPFFETSARSEYDGEVAISTQTSDVPARYSMSGRPCIFPSFRDGVAHEDCVFVGGIPMCVVDRSQDIWDECYLSDEEWDSLVAKSGDALFFNSSISVPNDTLWNVDLSSSQSMSMDGRKCVFPLTYSGLTINRCVNIDGEHMCWTEESAQTADVISDSTPAVENPFKTGRNRPQSSETVYGFWTACDENSMMDDPGVEDNGDYGVNASSVPVLVVDTRERYTTAGVQCQLPIVLDGEIIDDCIDIDGIGFSCLTTSSNGSWEACDMTSGTDIGTGSNGVLSVAQRQTIYGESCVLPAVWNGQLYFDCVMYSDSSTSGIMKVCPSESAAWELCAPIQEGYERTYKEFEVADALERSKPGTLGQLCTLEPSESDETHNCAEDLMCVPLPDLKIQSEGSTSNNLTTHPFDGIGFCAVRPEGNSLGIFKSLDEANAAQPLAYMPFTGGNLDSLMLPQYKGYLSNGNGLMWHPDPMFGMVPICSRSERTTLHLDRVPYAVNGDFAINLWMRRLGTSDISGDTFQYLFHHTSNASYSPGLTPNQISIYLTDSAHPAYPSVRALVRDSDDTVLDLVWLDSDGYVSSNNNRTDEDYMKQIVNVNDGAWHMITLSTLEDGSDGFALYVDGDLAGMLRQDVQLEDGSPAIAMGGDPVYMDEDILLCARADTSILPSDDRFFDGALTNLALWNSNLSSSQVKALYDSYDPAAFADAVRAQYQQLENGTMSLQGEEEDSSGDDGMSTGLIVGIVFAVVGGVAALAALGVLATSAMRRRRSNKRFQKFQDETGDGWGGSSHGEPYHNGNGMYMAGRGNPGSVGPVDGTFTVQLSNGGSKKFSLSETETWKTSPSHINTITPAASEGLGSAVSGGAAAEISSMSLGPALSSSGGIDRRGTDSVASYSTMTDDVEIDTGKRSLFKKGETRIVIPEDS